MSLDDDPKDRMNGRRLKPRLASPDDPIYSLGFTIGMSILPGEDEEEEIMTLVKTDLKKLMLALEFAARKHKDQRR